MFDTDRLRVLYDGLDDRELQRIAQTELVPEARTVLEVEMKARGLPLTGAEATEPVTVPRKRSTLNPYAPPASAVADPWAVLTVPGLIRLFQCMVVASALLGILFFVLPYLPMPISADVATLRTEATWADAISPMVSYFIFMALQPVWIILAFGLCFFKWWARPLLVTAYVLGAVGNLLGGLSLWMPWESILFTASTLLDGAVLALAFLPPLSAYFEQDRA
jgi:hypothetical protein